MKIRKTKAVRRGLQSVIRLAPPVAELTKLNAATKHEYQRALEWIAEQARGISEEEKIDDDTEEKSGEEKADDGA